MFKFKGEDELFNKGITYLILKGEFKVGETTGQ